VAPFKEENVKLIKENSVLRMEILRTQESREEALRSKFFIVPFGDWNFSN